jgi:hypothetical protein
MPDDKNAPLRSRAAVAPGGTKPIPGPTLREAGGSLPCGCKVAHDPEDNKLRYWFCPPHAVAYEMLEVLQEMQKALDTLVNAAPPDFDTAVAMDVGIKARRVLKRAKGDWRS